MIGIDLASITDDLRRVPVHLDHKPHLTFDLERALGSDAVVEASNYSGKTLADRARNLGMDDFKNLSVDQLFKLRRASIIMMSASVEDAIKSEPRLRVIHKIENSMWRWGTQRTGWNEIVDSYESIRRFSFHPDFEVRLDYTTSYNECGYSEYSRTFLDGVFGFLIYYRGQHVMTLGFSIMGRRRLLIQQVQLKNRQGNRWLFKLPRNYMEYVVGCFRAAFPKHNLFVIDGGDLTSKNLNSYRSGLKNKEEYVTRTQSHLGRCKPSERDFYEQCLSSALEEYDELQRRIEHIEPEIDRLTRLYRNTGVYAQSNTTVKANGLKHYGISA